MIAVITTIYSIVASVPINRISIYTYTPTIAFIFLVIAINDISSLRAVNGIASSACNYDILVTFFIKISTIFRFSPSIYYIVSFTRIYRITSAACINFIIVFTGSYDVFTFGAVDSIIAISGVYRILYAIIFAIVFIVYGCIRIDRVIA